MAVGNLLPQTITSFELFINGYALGGKVKSITLPRIAFKKDTYQTGGMSGEVAYHQGLEAMEFSASIADYDPVVITNTGFSPGKNITILARAATRNKSGLKVPYEARMKGDISSLDFGNWQLGTENELVFTMDCDYFRVAVAEIKLVEIDVLNMIQYIGGEDQLELDRAMILRTPTPTT